ncbi:hypothetical protein B0H10DRAFT_1718401, partial [Mycena sp. CBHHK59/15]
GRKRPARELGLVASNASYIVPEAIRKKFIAGWDSHVPLQYLTDKFCGINNGTATKALNDLWTMDGTSGSVVSVAKELPVDGELNLTLDEWFQAWQRLLSLIQDHIPAEYDLWLAHYESVLHRPTRAQQWSLCLAYDSRIRRLATVSSIDPSQFHLVIWNELETAFITNTAIQTLRSDLGLIPTQHRQNRTANTDTQAHRFHPYQTENRSRSGFPSQSSNNSFRPPIPTGPNPNRLAIMGTTSRCFVCGNSDPSHSSRRCHSRVLVNGSDAIIIVRKAGEPRKDSDGNAFCFAFNGRAGCTRGANCEQGRHWCSLCGHRDGSHTAQSC